MGKSLKEEISLKKETGRIFSNMFEQIKKELNSREPYEEEYRMETYIRNVSGNYPKKTNLRGNAKKQMSSETMSVKAFTHYLVNYLGVTDFTVSVEVHGVDGVPVNKELVVRNRIVVMDSDAKDDEAVTSGTVADLVDTYRDTKDLKKTVQNIMEKIENAN